MSQELTFSSWLRQRRTELGVTRDELSEQVGFSLDLLRKLESGARRPSGQVAHLLADYFHIPSDEREAFVTFARNGRSALAAGVTDDSTGTVRAPWRRAYKHQTNLPASLTSLIGRSQETNTLKELIVHPKVRLVTLTGAPGIGKTRLALKAAADMVEQFDDGVFLVELTSLVNPDLVLQTVAGTLGIKESGDQRIDDALLEYTRERRMLLVLDNFEQVLDASPMVVKLLEASPWLRILVTSREPLHARGERRFPVPPLELPELTHRPSLQELLSFPSIELFVERSRMSRPDFELTEQNSEAVARICVALDGLPLAIELAAGHAGFFFPQEIEGLLESRLQLLKTRALDLPARQRTLRGAIEWSYNLLSTQEQTVFRRLGVFAGGHTIRAASVVAGAEADGKANAEAAEVLEVLLDKSLITRGGLAKGEGAGSGAIGRVVGRLGMLESLRAYALEQLAARGETDETRERHARYFLNFVQEGGEHYAGSEVVTWSQQVAAEYPNIREALAWFFEAQGRKSKGEQVVQPGGNSHAGDKKEGREGGSAELERIMLGADLCIALFPFWDGQRYLSEARAWYTRAADSIGAFVEPLGNPHAPDPGQDTVETVLAREISPELLTAWATMLTGAAAMAFYQDDYAAARLNNEKALVIRRKIDDRSGIAASLNNLGIAAIDQGDYEAAWAYLWESLAIARELGVHRKICPALTNLGIAETRQGKLAEARVHVEESLALARRVEDLQRTAEALTNLGVVARLQGDGGEARRYLDEAHIIYAQLEHKSGIIQILIQLGFVARDEGRYGEGRAHFSSALSILTEVPKRIFIADCLEGMAWLLGKGGQLERSVRLFGAAEHLRDLIGIAVSAADHQYYDEFLSIARLQMDAGRWETLWAEGRAMSMEQAVTYALGEV